MLSLQSLKDLVALVPSSCERVRNLFQFLLLDSLKHFNNAIKTAKIGEDQQESLVRIKGTFKNVDNINMKFSQQLTDYQPQ